MSFPVRPLCRRKSLESYIQIEPVIRLTSISNGQLEQEISAALDEKRSGLIYFHYEQLARNPEKRQILKKYRAS